MRELKNSKLLVEIPGSFSHKQEIGEKFFGFSRKSDLLKMSNIRTLHDKVDSLAINPSGSQSGHQLGGAPLVPGLVPDERMSSEDDEETIRAITKLRAEQKRRKAEKREDGAQKEWHEDAEKELEDAATELDGFVDKIVPLKDPLYVPYDKPSKGGVKRAEDAEKKARDAVETTVSKIQDLYKTLQTQTRAYAMAKSNAARRVKRFDKYIKNVKSRRDKVAKTRREVQAIQKQERDLDSD